jgi:hypothetical protein
VREHIAGVKTRDEPLGIGFEWISFHYAIYGVFRRIRQV